MADKQHGAWRSGNRFALPTSPHPRRRLLEIRNSCATLTHPTAQKIGHSSLRLYSSVQLALTDETGRSFTVKRTYDPADDNPYEDADKGDIAQIFPVLFLSQNE